MRRAMTLPGSASLSALTILLMTLLPADGFGQEPCSGHKLLSKPRPEASCRNVAPQIFVSPDKALRALVLPVDVSKTPFRKMSYPETAVLSVDSFQLSLI